MSQSNAVGGHPTSFNTNVNRAKTKKWLDAKSYSYDGDDWGDVDDYDEYGGYNEPDPVPKPTGLRQRGQSATQPPQEGYGAGSEVYQSPVDARQPYNNISGTPPQQQYGGRNITNPQYQGPPAALRKNSFDQGDERRAFSAGGPQTGIGNPPTVSNPTPLPQAPRTASQTFQPSPMHPSQPMQAQPDVARPDIHIPTRSSMDAQSRHSDQPYSAGSALRGPQFLDQQRQGSRTHSMTSNNSSLDFHNRRDFSPSAIPPPLHTRGSPSPHSNPDSRSSSRHPPRKSSLSQENPPTLPFPTQGPPLTTASDLEEDLPVAREHTGSGAGKPLPFVRPADIYKRMQEEKEKEKERRSQESSRPSMDSVIVRQNEPPTPNKPQESEPPQRLKPTLEPVSERKSEYGMEGLNTSEPMVPEERRPTTSKKFELPNRASNTSSKPSTSSLPQMLPDVSRVSGFGESFFGSAGTSGVSFSDSELHFAGASSQPPSQGPRQTAPEKDLRNQPSLGFTSAVHQAFDKAEEQVPPTPSSTTGSTVGRSTSGGTSAVSPIISRGPSAATERLPGILDVTTPTIAESPEESNSRPRSSGSPSTLRQYGRGPSPPQGMVPESAESPPQSFIPGHRRDLSTPSPDNSPARTPAVESIRQLRQPQEVEIAASTPTDAGFSTSSSSQNSEIAQEDHPVGATAADAPLATSNHQAVGPHVGASNSSTVPDQTLPSSSATQQGRSRTDSSSSNRVRNLADKFESGSRPGSAHSTTPRASLLSNATQKKDEIAPPRPIADRMESFRPHLPGGWESSASIAPAPAAKGLESRAIRQQPEPVDSSAAFEPSPTTTSTGYDDDQSIAHSKPPSSVSQIKDATEEAFSALAAAGSALTGAFAAAAVGKDYHDSSTESSADKHAFRGEHDDREPNSRSRSTHSNTVVHPEASRPFLPGMTNDELSSEAPTPLPQTAETGPSATSKDPEYFPSPLSIHNASDTHTTNFREASPARQQPTLPPLTTDTKPRQYESDRLRKEIVRELTPMSPSEPTTAETDYSNYQDSKVSTNPSLSRPGHECGVIPKEYDSYWNDGNSDDESSEASREPSQLEHAGSTEGQGAASGSSELLHPINTKQQAPPPPILQEQPTKGLSQPVNLDPLTQEETVHERPRTLPHRFSWEQPLHDLSAGTVPSQEPTAAPTSDFLNSAIYPEGRSFQPQGGSSENEVTDSIQTGPSVSMNEPPKPPEKYNRIAPSESIPSSQWEQPDGQKELPVDPPGLEVSSSVGEQIYDKPLTNGHEDNVNVLAQPNPIGSYDARSDEHPLPELPQQGNLASTAPNTYPGNYNFPTLPPKIPAFREIVALKTPAERIRGFNDARDQFARLPIGLQAWVDETLTQLPEHEDLLTTSGRLFPSPQGHKSSPSRSKLGGLLPGGGQASQQTHQQQYLNTNPGPAMFNGPPQSGALISGSPQAYSPSGGSGGKMSSQQVQAKGKDLLHTAGVFGGKANVAAKELFSKGKSKFRATSGTEKASNLSSPSLPRGMQQQPPNLRAQSATPTRRTLYDGPPTAATEPVTPGLQRSPPSPEQKSPRDSPSLESFTQSQLGDDERSEESGRTSQEQPPRPSTLPDTRNPSDAKEEPIMFGATIGDNAPIFLQETPSADSYVGSPNEVHTPRSATSSNKTPTQASFAEKAQLARAQEKASIRESIERPPKPTSSPRSRFSLPAPQSQNDQGRDSARRHDPVSNTSQGFPKGYGDTIQSSNNGRDLRATNSATEGSSISQKADTNLQAPKSIVGQREEETASYVPLQPPQTSKKYGEYVSPTIPLLAPENIHQAPRSSQDYSQRAPDIDVTTGTSNTNRLPSPASQQATIRDLLEQRGRPGPVHYGIDHDFIPRNDQRHVRDRSPSYQGGLEDSVAHDSRQSLEPNTSTDSAFWQSDDSRGGTERSANYYPEQVPDNTGFVQRPRAEQGRADYVASPTEGRSESKPRSRRGSRSSAFFKSFGKTSEPDQPPLPDTSDVQAQHTPVQSPNSRERKGSRASILRSLKRNSGSWSGTGRSKENTTPTTSVPQYLPPGQSYQATPHYAKENSPSRDSNTKSKLDKKLQRASTSANVEQDSGKKKRFSAIGSLFGRSNPKRQSTVESSPLPIQQRPPAQMQQREVANAVPPRQSQQYAQGPSIEQPPPEGYYAPARLDSRDRQSSGGYTPTSSRTQQTRQLMSAQDAPAYIENSSLSQRPSQSTTSRTYPQTTTVTQTSTTFSPSPQPPSSRTTTRTSTTFSRNSQQPSSSSGQPAPSNPRNSSREPTPLSSGHGSQPSGSSWARFSSHSRSKSRNSQPQPPSTDTFPPASAPPVPSTRSHSPPPPPPPPKDEWHNHRPSHSTTSSISTITSMPPSQAPPPLPQPQSQPYNRPTSTSGNRQALPPLQTNMGGSNRNSAVRSSGKGLTPEEKRRSRQQEIERSTMSPQAVADLNARGGRDSGDEVVMSATSFPGQMWTPDYAHWEGE